MINDFNWYKIFNLPEFNALGLISQEYNIVLEGVGLKSFLVTFGNFPAITYEDTVLIVRFDNKNPFVFNGYGIFIKPNGDVFWGIPIDES